VQGVALGLLIGLLSGFVLMLLVRTAMRQDAKDLKAIVAVITELMSIPAFWFGGPWLTETFLSAMPPETLSAYVSSLAITFLVVASWPLGRLVHKVGVDVGMNG
jgi:nitrate reductase gamma subunit